MTGKPDKEWERRTFAIIESEGFLTLDNLTFSNIFRREWMPDAAPTIRLQRGAKIGLLRLRDIQQINMSDKPLVFFNNEASIVRLMVDGVVVREKTGADKAVTFVGAGTTLKKHGEFFTEGEQEWLDERKRVDEENKINPPKEQRL